MPDKEGEENIKVCIRIRPKIFENELKEKDIWEVKDN
jgi:hypothetical protein